MPALSYRHARMHVRPTHAPAQEWSYLRGGLTTIDRDYGIFSKIHHSIGIHVVHHLFPQVRFTYAHTLKLGTCVVRTRAGLATCRAQRCRPAPLFPNPSPPWSTHADPPLQPGRRHRQGQGRDGAVLPRASEEQELVPRAPV